MIKRNYKLSENLKIHKTHLFILRVFSMRKTIGRYEQRLCSITKKKRCFNTWRRHALVAFSIKYLIFHRVKLSQFLIEKNKRNIAFKAFFIGSYLIDVRNLESKLQKRERLLFMKRFEMTKTYAPARPSTISGLVLRKV